MAYELRPFLATDDADWSEAIELIDDATNGPLVAAADASFVLEVKDCGRAALTASTADGTITKPANNIIAWRFTPEQLRSLCAGNSYRVGCVMTTISGSVQLFVGSLSLIEGGLS